MDNQTQTDSFLFSTCDFLVNYRGCGTYTETFLQINRIFLILFSICSGMCAIFVMERLYSHFFVRSVEKKVLWNFGFIQGLMTLICFLIKVGGLASMRFDPFSNNISDQGLSSIVSTTIILEALYQSLGNYTLFKYSRFILQTLGRFREGETMATSHKTTYVAYYQIALQLAIIVCWVCFASVGVQYNPNTYILWRSLMTFLGSVDYIVEPYFLWLFGVKIIKNLKVNLKKNPKLQGKINRIQNTILSISLTRYMPFGYLAYGLGSYCYQSNTQALIYLIIFTLSIQCIGAISASVLFFKVAIHNLVMGKQNLSASSKFSQRSHAVEVTSV